MGVTLLADLRTVFDGADKMSTEAILEGLTPMKESPWANCAASRWTLAGSLVGSVSATWDPGPLRFDDDTVARGYEATELADPWDRYLW